MRMKNKTHKRKSIVKWIIFIVVVSILAKCTKAEIGERQFVFDRYEMIVDWYSLDTTRLIKAPAYRQVFDSIYKYETRMAFDTCSDKWYIDCNMLDVLQHLYYKKNGIKIQPSAFPKSK